MLYKRQATTFIPCPLWNYSLKFYCLPSREPARTLFFFFKWLFIRARGGNLQGPCCFSNYSVLGPEQGTCKVPIVFQIILIYLFFFVPNDRIFHCLNIPQNSPNLEYKSHLAKNFIIHCCPEFPPLGGSTIKGSAFWLVTPIYFVAHSKTLYPHVQWIVLNLVV